jgi:hypothetical protein
MEEDFEDGSEEKKDAELSWIVGRSESKPSSLAGREDKEDDSKALIAFWNEANTLKPESAFRNCDE